MAHIYPLADLGTVEAWYNRPERSWVVQVKNLNGDQVGEARYVYTKMEAMVEVGYLQMQADKANNLPKEIKELL
jgi:hypothetical protein